MRDSRRGSPAIASTSRATTRRRQNRGPTSRRRPLPRRNTALVERTCVVCRARRGRDGLVRLGEGRGAWVCRTADAVHEAGLVAGLVRGLRRAVGAEELERLRDRWRAETGERGGSR